MNASTTNDESPPPWNHRTTTGILQTAAITFFSLLPIFFFLSLLLFSFRYLLETAAVFATTVIDRDSSIAPLISLLQIPNPNPNPNPNLSHSPFRLLHRHHLRRRHRPFLYLTRLGVLGDDLFSGDDDDHNHDHDHDHDHRSLIFNHLKPNPNSTFVTLHQLNTRFRLSRVQLLENEVKIKDERENGVDTRFFIAGLEFSHRDTAALLFLVIVLMAAYGCVIYGCLITYSSTIGIVCISVVNNLLGKYNNNNNNHNYNNNNDNSNENNDDNNNNNTSFLGIVWEGCNLGVKKVSGFILMRWAIRDTLTQVIGMWFFGEIQDLHSFFKLFLWVKLMPFSVSLPWVSGYDNEVSGFLLWWFLMDTVVSFVFAVNSWVLIANSRRVGGREIVKEGCFMLGIMIHQSIQLMCFELIMCGAFTKWVLGRLCGRPFAVFVQALVEVYFMVVWLIYYFAARSKDANLSGRRFGRRELEGLIEGRR